MPVVPAVVAQQGGSATGPTAASGEGKKEVVVQGEGAALPGAGCQWDGPVPSGLHALLPGGGLRGRDQGTRGAHGQRRGGAQHRRARARPEPAPAAAGGLGQLRAQWIPPGLLQASCIRFAGERGRVPITLHILALNNTETQHIFLIFSALYAIPYCLVLYMQSVRIIAPPDHGP